MDLTKLFDIRVNSIARDSSDPLAPDLDPEVDADELVAHCSTARCDHSFHATRGEFKVAIARSETWRCPACGRGTEIRMAFFPLDKRGAPILPSRLRRITSISVRVDVDEKTPPPR